MKYLKMFNENFDHRVGDPITLKDDYKNIPSNTEGIITKVYKNDRYRVKFKVGKSPQYVVLSGDDFNE